LVQRSVVLLCRFGRRMLPIGLMPASAPGLFNALD
jgi:hypothetical protein